MHILLTVSALILTVITLLPLSKKQYWWIRIFDYPRVQIAVTSIVAISLMLIYSYTSAWEIVLICILAAATVFQAVLIYPYTPFAKAQTLKSTNTDENIRLRMFVNNIRQSNKKTDKVLKAIEKSDPDIILLMETDKHWAESVISLNKKYPYRLQEPLDNTYGMLFFSRFPLQNAQINYLVDNEIPSVYCEVELRSGDKINLYCLHPQPPTPKSDTDERDAEIVIVGKTVKQKGEPAIVMGDLNDVAWSHTTRLFQRISGMSDPRVGRGFFNTYNAFIPVFRFPLDHIFHTSHFRLVRLQRLPSTGSDHFPMFIELSYEPERKNVQDIPKADTADKIEAEKKIQMKQ